MTAPPCNNFNLGPSIPFLQQKTIGGAHISFPRADFSGWPICGTEEAALNQQYSKERAFPIAAYLAAFSSDLQILADMKGKLEASIGPQGDNTPEQLCLPWLQLLIPQKLKPNRGLCPSEPFLFLL